MSSETESRTTSGARELIAHEVLVVDSDPMVQKGLVTVLAPAGLHVTGATSPERALELVTTKFFGVVVVDLDTPAPGAGIALVGKIQERSPQTLVIVLSPRKSFDGAVNAFRAGARDVIVKAPDQVEYLRDRIIAAAGDISNRNQTETLLGQIRETFEDFLKRMMEAERRATDLEDRVNGRDLSRADVPDEMRILVVDSDDRLFKALVSAEKAGFQFFLSQTGGEALDRVTTTAWHIALVGQNVPDLPPSMIIKALKSQAPDMIVISYEPNGRLEIVENSRTIPLVDKFTAASQLTERLDELAGAHRAKGRERRYLQAFRDKHYEFLRRLSELRRRIEKAIGDGKET
jgi:DNA-binding NtrC family response regulator